MELNTHGIIFMSIAWGAVSFLTFYCFYKVFKTEKKN